MAGYTAAQIATMQAKLPGGSDGPPDANGVNMIYAGILPPSSAPPTQDFWNSTGIPASQVNSMGSGLSSYVDQNGQRVVLPGSAASAAAGVGAGGTPPYPATFPGGPPIDYSDPMWGGDGPPNDYSDPIWGRTAAIPPTGLPPLPVGTRPPAPAVRPPSAPSTPSAPAPTPVRLASGTMATVGQISVNPATGYSYRVNADGTTTNLTTGHVYGTPAPTNNLATIGSPDTGISHASSDQAPGAAAYAEEMRAESLLDPAQRTAIEAAKLAASTAAAGAKYTAMGAHQLADGRWALNGQFVDNGIKTGMYNPTASGTPTTPAAAPAGNTPPVGPPQFLGPPVPAPSNAGQIPGPMGDQLASFLSRHGINPGYGGPQPQGLLGPGQPRGNGPGPRQPHHGPRPGQ